MNYTDIILLAIALSIDACVVSFSYGLCSDRRKRINSLLLASTTGLFQAFMPILGALFANLIKSVILPYSKWIVFIIFIYLGIIFIREALTNKEQKALCVDLKTLLLIGVATSIDSLSAGIPLFLTGSPMKFSITVIGFITFINSQLGYWLGCVFKRLNSRFLEILGGLILIFLAIKSILV